MNLVKKIAIAATILCAATVANAEGLQIGGRLNYSMQMVGLADNGMLGAGAGVVFNIPVGPVTIGPEVAFLYRTNFGGYPQEKYDANALFPTYEEVDQTEMAISVPILVKYFPIEGLYVQAGVQVDLPLAAKLGDEDMDGKDQEIDIAGVKTKIGKNWERSTVDFGIPVGVGYMIMPNLSVDVRYVIGLLPLAKYEISLFGLTSEIELDPLSSVNVGVTYFF